ncbi:MAG: c-type cytochrome [Sphingomonadales bacterium]
MLSQRNFLQAGVLLCWVFSSCGESDRTAAAGAATTQVNAADETKAAAADPSRTAVYQKGLSLVAKSDCLTCHKIDEPMTGPSYSAIAEKYAGAPNDAITALAGTIIKGGSGNWGNVPMTPHPSLSQDDAETMVRYILELNNR